MNQEHQMPEATSAAQPKPNIMDAGKAPVQALGNSDDEHETQAPNSFPETTAALQDPEATFPDDESTSSSGEDTWDEYISSDDDEDDEDDEDDVFSVNSRRSQGFPSSPLRTSPLDTGSPTAQLRRRLRPAVACRDFDSSHESSEGEMSENASCPESPTRLAAERAPRQTMQGLQEDGQGAAMEGCRPAFSRGKKRVRDIADDQDEKGDGGDKEDDDDAGANKRRRE